MTEMEPKMERFTNYKLKVTSKFFEKSKRNDQIIKRKRNFGNFLPPNSDKCSVCNAFEEPPRLKLITCVNCKFTSYCKTLHQLVDLGRHNDFCQAVSTILKVIRSDGQVVSNIIDLIKLIPYDSSSTYLPKNIQMFMNAFLFRNVTRSASLNDSEKFFLMTLQKHISQYFTRPLSLLFAMETLKFNKNRTNMTIHVISFDHLDEKYLNEWEFILHWLPNLINLKIVFVGLTLVAQKKIIKICDRCLDIGKSFRIESYNMLYKDYWEKKNIMRPDIFADFDNIVCTFPEWRESLKMLGEIGCPIVLAASSETDMEKCDLLVDTFFKKSGKWSKNPFGSLMPRRNYSVDEIFHDNNYIFILTELSLKEPNRLVRSLDEVWRMHLKEGNIKYFKNEMRENEKNMKIKDERKQEQEEKRIEDERKGEQEEKRIEDERKRMEEEKRIEDERKRMEEEKRIEDERKRMEEMEKQQKRKEEKKKRIAEEKRKQREEKEQAEEQKKKIEEEEKRVKYEETRMQIELQRNLSLKKKASELRKQIKRFENNIKNLVKDVDNIMGTAGLLDAKIQKLLELSS